MLLTWRCNNNWFIVCHNIFSNNVRLGWLDVFVVDRWNYSTEIQIKDKLK